jgi:hypothetical protein
LARLWAGAEAEANLAAKGRGDGPITDRWLSRKAHRIDLQSEVQPAVQNSSHKSASLYVTPRRTHRRLDHGHRGHVTTGSDANTVINNFNNLSKDAQTAVLVFLRSL